jgi:hypothetical protein
MSDEVAVTTRYAMWVNEMPQAWAFVMEHLDLVGPDPSVKITPHMAVRVGAEDEEPRRRFSVVIEGTTNVDHKIQEQL